MKTSRIKKLTAILLPLALSLGTACGSDDSRDGESLDEISQSLTEIAVDYGTNNIFTRAPGNTYNPASALVYVPKGLNIYTVRLTGEAYNHDCEKIPRLLRVVVNGNTYSFFQNPPYLQYGVTGSLNFTLPANVLQNGWNEIQAYVHWSNSSYDCGHWVTLNLVLETKTVNVAGFGTTTIFSNERGNTYNKAYARVNIPSWMNPRRSLVSVSGWGFNQDTVGYDRTMQIIVNGHQKEVIASIDDNRTGIFNRVYISPLWLRSGQNDVYAYIHWSNDHYDSGHRLELKLNISPIWPDDPFVPVPY